jgi:DNA-binding NtrC family response regulator
MTRILVVDDDPGFRGLLEAILKGEGYQVTSAANVAEARKAVATPGSFHVVVTDLRLPDGDGLQVLGFSKERMPDTPVIVITAFGAVRTAVDAMKLGAMDYLTKPLSSPAELRHLVAKAIAVNQVECASPAAATGSAAAPCGSMIAGHPSMQRILEMIVKVAPTSATVLISGESGTGKENIARCIHARSPRSAQPFIAINCAALSPSLIESELFGHEKGAFTGAASQHIGRFERAHQGTLFLDEIGELDASLQAKLLRVLQERQFERVGGTRLITVDTRVVAATNRDLRKLVAGGTFREDLYYRLNLFPLDVPPLRARGEDILQLARYFLSRAAKRLAKPELQLTSSTEAALLAHSWPGNVRELENLMERAAILDSVEMVLSATASSSSEGNPKSFRDIEQQAILEALATNGGNRTRTAQQLGISLRTLQYRLKDYGINA